MKWRLPSKDKYQDYNLFMTKMTEKLKNELAKQIKLKNSREKMNELRSAFSEGREFLRELTAQNGTSTVEDKIDSYTNLD